MTMKRTYTSDRTGAVQALPGLMKKNRNRAGTTMVETLVALAIFASFIAGAARVIMAHRQLTDKARMHYTAINIAKNQIEQVRNMRRSDYEQVSNMQEVDVRVDENGVPDSSGVFSRTTTISATSVSDLHDVAVTVDILNPVTLQFSGENEHIRSFMAKLLEI